MITDRENMFCEKLLVTADGTVGDVIKVNNRQRKQNLDLFIQVETDINNATSIGWKFVSSASSDLSSPTTIADSGAIALATLNADSGYRYVAPLSAIPATHNYVGLVADVTGTAPDAGAVTAGIVETAVRDTDTRPTYYTGR
jgi:hypothetical protein